MLDWYWVTFFVTEILSYACIGLFVVIRYVWMRPALSKWSIVLFILLNVFDIVVAFFMYRETGAMSIFQVVVLIFILYALTFGRSDFKRLDFWIRKQLEKWLKKELITEQERRTYEKRRYGTEQVKVTAKEWCMHALLFVCVNGLFLVLFPSETVTLTDVLSERGIEKWQENPSRNGLFREGAINQVVLIWGLIFLIDTIFSWWIILFPDKKNTP